MRVNRKQPAYKCSLIYTQHKERFHEGRYYNRDEEQRWRKKDATDNL